MPRNVLRVQRALQRTFEFARPRLRFARLDLWRDAVDANDVVAQC